LKAELRITAGGLHTPLRLAVPKPRESPDLPRLALAGNVDLPYASEIVDGQDHRGHTEVVCLRFNLSASGCRKTEEQNAEKAADAPQSIRVETIAVYT
jgi:hypothetical protein